MLEKMGHALLFRFFVKRPGLNEKMHAYPVAGGMVLFDDIAQAVVQTAEQCIRIG